MFAFEHTEYLFALLIAVPLIVVFLLVLRWKRKVKKSLGDVDLIERLTISYSSKLYNLKFIAIALAIVFMIFAAANLRKPVAGDNEPSAGIDVMIAMDVSKSMLSADIKPSRLERAKECVNLLIDNLHNNRVGLVLFAGEAFLQMPLTSDAAAAKIYLSNASPDAVPVQGTVISEALQLCDNSLDTKEKKYKAIILISDGEDHDPKAEETAKELYDHGVIVYTIGLGTAEGSPIFEPGTNSYKTDVNGQTVISKLNEAELSSIAKITGGDYYHLENVLTTSNEVVKALGSMDKKLIEGVNGERQYASTFPLFIGLALLLLIAEIFIPETKKYKH